MISEVKSRWRFNVAGIILILPVILLGENYIPCVIGKDLCNITPVNTYYFMLILLQLPLLLIGIISIYSLISDAITLIVWKILNITVIIWGLLSLFIVFIIIAGSYRPDGYGLSDSIYLILAMNIIFAIILPFLLRGNNSDTSKAVGKFFIIAIAAALVVWLSTSIFVSRTIRQRAEIIAPQGYQLLIPKFWHCDSYVPINKSSLFWLSQYALSFGNPDPGTPVYGPVPYHLILVPTGNTVSDNLNNYHWSFRQMDFIQGLSGVCRPL